MTDNTNDVPVFRRRIGHPQWRRQCAILLATCLLSGCSADFFGPPVKLAGSTPTASGFAAGDEPRAVGVGREILAQGGNAADAAVALGLALAVTLPSRAGLGGGGACLARHAYEVNDTLLGPRYSKTVPPTEAVEFLPRAPREGAQIGLPSLASGLFALHAKYGKLRWEQLVAPAENLARFGMPVSRALIRDIAAAHAEITGPSGKPLAEGEKLPQGELANVLAALRTQGANAMHLGELADGIVAGSDGAIDAAALRGIAANWSVPEGIEFGNDRVYFTPAPGGVFAQSLWQKVNGTAGTSFLTSVVRTIAGDSKPDAKETGARQLAIADAAAGMLPAAAEAADPVEGDAATGFVVVDRGGAVVACSVTMGRKFGAGRALGRTGILASVPVPSTGSDGLSGAAMVWANLNSGQFLGAFAGGGDRSGVQSLVETALGAMTTRQSLDDALTRPRLYAAAPGVFLAEPGLPLGERRATETKGLGAVNAVICPSGLPSQKPDCSVEADPRGAGAGAVLVR
jgi:gamma-glutamyltranspeptidase/glutathione hydrolase